MILPADERDLPEILALTHRAYGENVARGFRTSGAAEPLESLVHAWRENRVYKLVEEAALVGTVRLTFHADYLLVWRLCVDPASQRLGRGSALLRFAEEEAVRLGLPAVRLETVKAFQDLVDWYRRRGYAVIAEIPPPEAKSPSLVMEKRVT